MCPTEVTLAGRVKHVHRTGVGLPGSFSLVHEPQHGGGLDGVRVHGVLIEVSPACFATTPPELLREGAEILVEGRLVGAAAGALSGDFVLVEIRAASIRPLTVEQAA